MRFWITLLSSLFLWPAFAQIDPSLAVMVQTGSSPVATGLQSGRYESHVSAKTYLASRQKPKLVTKKEAEADGLKPQAPSPDHSQEVLPLAPGIPVAQIRPSKGLVTKLAQHPDSEAKSASLSRQPASLDEVTHPSN